MANDALDFGPSNTTRHFTVAGGSVLPAADWCIGFWTRDTRIAGANFDYAVSRGTLGAVNSLQIFVGQASSGNNGQIGVRARGAAGTEFNQTTGTIFTASGNDIFVVVQKRGTAIEIYGVVEGAAVSAPNLSSTSNVPGEISAGTWYLGARSDLNTSRFWQNPFGEFFCLAGDSLSAAEVQTLAAGAHITAVRPSFGQVEIDLRFRGNNSVEPDLGNAGADATRVGTGYTLVEEFFPDTSGSTVTGDQTETLTVADTCTATVVRSAARAEALTPVAAQTAARTMSATRTESIVPVAEQAALRITDATRAETINPTAAQAALRATGVAREEAIVPVAEQAASRATSVARAETLTPDAAQSALAARSAARTETLTLVDSASAVATYAASVTEAINLITQGFTGAVVVASRVETLALSDSASAIRTLLAQITEGISPAVAATAVSAHVAHATEPLTLVDTLQALGVIQASTAEALALSIAAVAVRQTAASIQETVTITDQYAFILPDGAVLTILHTQTTMQPGIIAVVSVDSPLGVDTTLLQ